MAATKLLMCVSQSLDSVVKPYIFKMTNIRVFSFEEVLYHCGVYWKQSIDDFLSDELISWVLGELNLPVIAEKMRLIAGIDAFTEKFMSFLTMTDYYERGQLDKIKNELLAWEKRNEWEKLKERGDYLINNAEYEKAFVMYKKAILFAEDNPVLFNNAAIALMKQGRYSEGIAYLKRAVSLDENNVKLILHLVEASILNGDYSDAKALLSKAEKFGETADVSYFNGQIEFFSGNYFTSIPYYERAIELNPDVNYLFSLSDVYVKLRQYDKSIETMNLIKIKDKAYLRKLASIYEKANNVPASVKCIERAIIANITSVDLWMRLAKYHRMDYDLNRAGSAILKALGLSKTNQHVNLEYARIRKAQGRIKDYQVILHSVLEGFKENYRETESIE